MDYVQKKSVSCKYFSFFFLVSCRWTNTVTSLVSDHWRQTPESHMFRSHVTVKPKNGHVWQRGCHSRPHHPRSNIYVRQQHLNKVYRERYIISNSFVRLFEQEQPLFTLRLVAFETIPQFHPCKEKIILSLSMSSNLRSKISNAQKFVSHTLCKPELPPHTKLMQRNTDCLLSSSPSRQHRQEARKHCQQ